MKILDLQQVYAWRLCLGCGACVYVCPKNNIKLIDVLDDGLRPTIMSNICGTCNECIKVCPGYESTHQDFEARPELILQLKRGWGPIIEVWEGCALDPQIRFSGSSGGITTALALYCLEKEGMHGTLHIGPDPQLSLKNMTVLSLGREDLLRETGSRYSPASPCAGLKRIEEADSPCVFIGKPCDVAGLRKAQSFKPELDKRVGVAIGIFCAGTPTTQGTLDLLRRLNVNAEEAGEIRYRGKGWPGETTVQLRGQNGPTYRISYMESWGFLQKYRPYRCHLCPDGTSEFADISCGDPWYREIQEGDLGHSLVLVRTERGRRILHGAIEEGYVTLRRAPPEILKKSQKNLLAKRQAIWGRLFAMKAFGIPTPSFTGFYLFENWLHLSMSEKIRSILGTVRRIIQRGYYKPLDQL